MRLMVIQVVDSGEEKQNKQAFHSDLAAIWFRHRHSIKRVPAKAENMEYLLKDNKLECVN